MTNTFICVPPPNDISRCGIHGDRWMPGEGFCLTVQVLMEVRAERERQFTLHGNNAETLDGTGPDVMWLYPFTSFSAEWIEKTLRVSYEATSMTGPVSWMQIAREEIAEAFQETDPERLAEELIQCAAVFVSWAAKVRGRAL